MDIANGQPVEFHSGHKKIHTNVVNLETISPNDAKEILG